MQLKTKAFLLSCLSSTLTMAPATDSTAAKSPDCQHATKPFITSRVIHFICDFLKLLSLFTGCLGSCCIWLSKQQWCSKRLASYNITAIVGFILVFSAAVAQFIQVNRLQFHDIALFIKRTRREQSEKEFKQKGATKFQSKIKSFHTRSRS
ncbi:PREDICTED: uncharacterized protein LOC108377879 [Rhagoletis zephyria]|uniref:uncharacterized protein LOC108377879 n=1 Tax=Rhagoletis zephyria TaxID=28612 RepID=UPI0008119752|nr:PREDICTED: uncharacterized protein LOC108377879 [Rhagoletis zephyria]